MSAGESAGHRQVRVGSPRAFGFVFAGAFTVIALLPMLKGDEPRLWALGVAAVFLLVALAAPRLLQPLNLVWFRIGLLLHAVVNPVVMSLIFWVTVVPMGLIMRAAGKDLLRLKRDPGAQTYWIGRDPGPERGSMSRQF